MNDEGAGKRQGIGRSGIPGVGMEEIENNWKDYNTANWEASSKSGTVAKRIRGTREEEKRNHRIREEAWNAALLGRKG